MSFERGIYRDLGKNYSEWFDYVLENAEIYDYGRYPVKGMGIWLPYGFKLRRNVVELIRKLLDETGHEEILLPLLIPELIFRKESEHVRGFEGEVYWVTHGGLEPLDIKLALRPTSETSLTYLESFWIKSYRQLPKKYYQVVSIFRYETKATRPMIRLREVTTFKEAHTVHESFEDAERQVKEAIGIYAKFFDILGIPYVISKRPEWDKFAGAVYTIAFDTLLPDGKALQIGTVHHLGQTFTKVFEVRIQKKDESLDYAWQTSYGISDRVVASVISIHGDSRGLVLPFIVAPIKVVIIPIPGKTPEENEGVRRFVNEVKKVLEDNGFTTKVDDREDVRPGEKFYYWEMRGVPIRIEIGVREVKERSVTVFRRDMLKREVVKFDELIDHLKKLAKDIDENLRKRAWEKFREHVRRVKDLNEAREVLEKFRGIVEVPWCGKRSCGLVMADEVNARMLGTPIEEVPESELKGLKCPICGEDAKTIARLAKTY
ncbi:MAG: proline--tRNA ligase [Thermoprotei archaeon]|nr:MAG: proline--tRNA ligase [Thermoprotei archaeon]